VPSPDDLASIPLFKQLTPTARAALAARIEVAEFTPGQRLVSQGDSGYSFFVVAHGRAAVTQDDHQLRYLDTGDYFGEVAILDGVGRRTATVTAVTNVVAWVMFGTALTSLQEGDPTVAAQLQQVMDERRSDV
jgi:CRP-like cAMP-binding protein